MGRVHRTSEDCHVSYRYRRSAPGLHRRFGRPDHHGQRRSRARTALAGEARRGRAGGPVRQPHRAARSCNRGPQPFLVRAQHRAAGPRRAALGQAFGNSLDGGHLGRNRGGHGSRVRGQVHAALVILRRGSGREVHGAAPAQHVGHPFADVSAVNHHRRRQMGRGRHTFGPALSHRSGVGGKEVLALRPIRRSPAPHHGRAAKGRASMPSASSI
jgi:hypothetical protein